MAYSRWSKFEVWYTFWTASCSQTTRFKFPTKKLKYNQFFEICDYPSYYVSYGELKEKGLKKVVKEIQDFYKEHKITELSDYTKLRRYLIMFMSDVDEHFEWNNFFIYEWFYPIRNNLIWGKRKFLNRIKWKSSKN